MASKFKTGDLVWAKIRYCTAWPAKVVDPPLDSRKKNSYYVFFYGSENFAWVKTTNICFYKTNYVVQRDVRNKLYHEAVQKISEVYHEQALLKSDYDFINVQKPKRSKEEEEERRRKIQERLKVRLFPMKNAKKKVNKMKKIKKGKKSSVIETASGPCSSIPSSSRIITVNVCDYKKVIPYDAVVLLRRCDEGIPALTCDSDEPEYGCQEDQPPTLLPEL